MHYAGCGAPEAHQQSTSSEQDKTTITQILCSSGSGSGALTLNKLFAKSRCSFVRHLDSLNVGAALGVDPVQSLVLPVQGRVHVVGHVADVAHHGRHLAHKVRI